MKTFKKAILSVLLLLLPVITLASQPVVITDQDRTNTVVVIDGKLRNINQPYRLAILEGLIPDHEGFDLEGHNPAISTTNEVMWAVPSATQKLYVWPAAADTLKVASSDAADDGDPAGTGARTLQITGLLADYSEATETVTLNGTTNVNTTTEFLRVNEIKVLTAGSGQVAAGNITVKDNTDTNILSWITAGENISFQAIYTVPADMTLYIDEIKGSGSGTKNVHVRLLTREVGGLFYQNKHRTINDSPFDMSRLTVPEKTDLQVLVHSDVTGGIADVSIEGWTEE